MKMQSNMVIYDRFIFIFIFGMKSMTIPTFVKVSELIDEDDGEVRVDVKYNAKGAPRVRAVKSNIQLPDINPVLARINNSGIQVIYTTHISYLIVQII